MFDTPMGSNTIPEPTLTKAQKTFSSQAITPNLPKPKSLYFVYFHLNPALEKRIEYKNIFIKTLLDKKYRTRKIKTNPINILIKLLISCCSSE